MCGPKAYCVGLLQVSLPRLQGRLPPRTCFPGSAMIRTGGSNWIEPLHFNLLWQAVCILPHPHPPPHTPFHPHLRPHRLVGNHHRPRERIRCRQLWVVILSSIMPPPRPYPRTVSPIFEHTFDTFSCPYTFQPPHLSSGKLVRRPPSHRVISLRARVKIFPAAGRGTN